MKNCSVWIFLMPKNLEQDSVFYARMFAIFRYFGKPILGNRSMFRALFVLESDPDPHPNKLLSTS